MGSLSACVSRWYGENVTTNAPGLAVNVLQTNVEENVGDRDPKRYAFAVPHTLINFLRKEQDVVFFKFNLLLISLKIYLS